MFDTITFRFWQKLKINIKEMKSFNVYLHTGMFKMRHIVKKETKVHVNHDNSIFIYFNEYKNKNAISFDWFLH